MEREDRCTGSIFCLFLFPPMLCANHLCVLYLFLFFPSYNKGQTAERQEELSGSIILD